jgi:hypothetical protein
VTNGYRAPTPPVQRFAGIGSGLHVQRVPSDVRASRQGPAAPRTPPQCRMVSSAPLVAKLVG